MRTILRTVALWSALLPAIGAAQTPTTPAECYRRCTTLAFEDPELLSESYKEKIKKIQARKKQETDPLKIRELEEIEDAEMEKLKRSLAKTCTKICKYEN